MNQTGIDKLNELDWHDIAPRLLVFAHRWAGNVYGWRDGILPNGMSLEDVTKEAIAAFATGDRKLNDRFDIVIQLKGAIRSILWKIYQKRVDKFTSAESPVFFDMQDGETPDPATVAEGKDFCREFIQRLSADGKVATNPDLLAIVNAYAKGAETIEDVVEQTGLEIGRLYELRRSLKDAATRILKMMNKKERVL